MASDRAFPKCAAHQAHMPRPAGHIRATARATLVVVEAGQELLNEAETGFHSKLHVREARHQLQTQREPRAESPQAAAVPCHVRLCSHTVRR